jgi:hypothetical protein
MRIWRLTFIGAYLGLSGCVVGYGPCLLQPPFKNTLTGHVHFRDYPTADGVDNVPILTTDKTAYIYAPAESIRCQPANDIQLVGVIEFPQNITENSHVTVEGTLFQSANDRQYTPFVMNVNTILSLPDSHDSHNSHDSNGSH